MVFFFFPPSLSFTQQKQQLSTSHRRRRPENKRRKTIHYPAQQPRVQIVHSVLRHSGRKCAVNAGKQRDWRVTNNERHLGGLRGGTMMAWGARGCSGRGQHFPQQRINFGEVRETYVFTAGVCAFFWKMGVGEKICSKEPKHGGGANGFRFVLTSG